MLALLMKDESGGLNMYYVKPNMNDLPAELGKKIFAEMDKARVNFDELDKKCLELKLKILKENEKANTRK